MAVVFLKSQDNEILALDAVESIEQSQSNSMTKSSVMSGAQTSDGYTIGNISVAFNGICTYSKIVRSGETVTPPNPDDLDRIIKSMVNSQTRFTMYGNSLIPTLKDVVITGWTTRVDDYSNAVRVSIALEQANISASAQTIRISRPTTAAEEELPEEPKFGLKDILTPTVKKKAVETLQKWQLTVDPLSAGVI